MPTIKHLVFEGGGVKGIAYAGALAVLEEQGLLAPVEMVAGSSVGAIVALLLALGYTSDEVKNLLAINFKDFLDGSGLATKRGLDFLAHWGIHPGERLKDWLEEQVVARLGPNATFADLHAKTLEEGANKAVNHFRELHVYAADLNTRQPVLLSYYTTPDLPLSLAVRASAALPLFFRPIEVMIGEQKHTLVDGGLTCNYPVALFDANYPHPETLGFRLDTAEEIGFFTQGHSMPYKEVKSLPSYASALFECAMSAQHQFQVEEGYRTIYIDTLDISTTAFSMPEEDKERLIEQGRLATQRFLVQQEVNPLTAPSVTARDRLAKADRYRLYEKAAWIHASPILDAAEGILQWLFLVPKEAEAPHHQWFWLKKMERYVNRLKAQPGIIRIEQARMPAGFNLAEEERKAYLIEATVKGFILEEARKWLVKYQAEARRCAKPFTLSDCIIQQSCTPSHKPAWLLPRNLHQADSQQLIVWTEMGARHELVHYITQIGFPAGIADVEGNTLLHIAARHGDERLASLFIDHERQALDKTNRWGDTPLHAAIFGSAPIEVIQLLLVKGAKCNVKNKDGQTPLMMAVQKNNGEAIRTLVQAGADVTLTDNRGLSALNKAEEAGFEEIAEFLLQLPMSSKAKLKR